MLESSSDNSSVSVAELENNRKLHLSISNPQGKSKIIITMVIQMF